MHIYSPHKKLITGLSTIEAEKIFNPLPEMPYFDNDIVFYISIKMVTFYKKKFVN